MKTIRIRRVRLFTAGKMFGCVGAFMGLLAGIPITLVATLATAGSTAHAASGAQDAVSTAAFIWIPAVFIGAGAIILLPLAYGLAAFITGFLHALVYNFVAGFVGGLVIETD